MIVNAITIPNEAEKYIPEFENLVRRIGGKYTPTHTKDGTYYELEFETDNQSNRFNDEVKKNFPNIFL